MDNQLACYLRCSTNEQDVAHQRLAIRGWLDTQGLADQPVREYMDHGISGTVSQAGRAGYAELVRDIEQGKINRLIMFEVSRASRDFMEFLRFVELCCNAGCIINVVGSSQPVQFASSSDKLITAVQAFLAQAEREKVSERTKSGLARARAEGKQLGAPKGHERNKGRRKQYSPDLVAEIQHLAKAGLSVRRISSILGTRFNRKGTSYGTVIRIMRRCGINGAVAE